MSDPNRLPEESTDAAYKVVGVIAAAVVAVVLATAGMFVLASQALTSTRLANDRAQDTRTAIEKVQQILSSLQDAETGERGYVITGDEAFLEPYLAARSSLDQQLRELDPLLDDPLSHHIEEELHRRARQQMAFLGAVIAVRKSGDERTAAELIRRQIGKRQMDGIRDILADLRSRERARLADSLAVADRTSAHSQRIIQGSSLVSVLAILVAGGLLIRYARQRWRAEQTARRAAAALRTTMENIAQGVLVLDARGRIVAWNPRYLELRRADPKIMRIGMPFSEMQQLAVPMTYTVAGVAHQSRTPGSVDDLSKPFEGEAMTQDGLLLQISGRPAPLGQFIITLSDITAVKRSEAAHRDQAVRLASVLDNVEDAIITINESGSIESWSKSAERLFGYTSEEILQRNVEMLMPDPHASAHDGYLRRDVGTAERRMPGTRREVEARHKDGHRFAVELGISEMQLDAQRLFIGVVRDLSERAEVERLKSGFVSTVSHELRTPLTSICASLGLLATGAMGEAGAKASRLIEIARSNCERLIRLINDILDLEKAESGKLQFHLEQQRLKPILQQAIDTNRGYARSFGVTLELQPHGEDGSVLVDRERLVQVLTNLLSNAAKFSPRGGIVRVAAQLSGDWIRVTVEDDGPGIAPEFQQRIFQKFAQADASDSRARGGTGLGLSVAKILMERLGGSVGFDPAPRKGACFHLTLPITRTLQIFEHVASDAPMPGAIAGCDGEPDAAAPRSSSPRSRILHVEDDASLAHLVRTIMEPEAEVVSANSLAAARMQLARGDYDAVILDPVLKDGSALELLPALKGSNGKKVPIVLYGADEPTHDALAEVDAALVKSRDTTEQLVATLRALTQPPADVDTGEAA